MKRLYIYISVLFFGIYCIACNADTTDEATLIQDDQVAIEVGEGVEVIYSDSGRIEMKVIAPILHRYLDRQNPRRSFPAGLKVIFIGKDQKETSWLVGKQATEFENTHETVIRDSVVLININGEMLETDHLVWDQKNGTIHTDQLVKMTTFDKQIIGYGFEADREFTRWSIKAVKGELKVDPFNLDSN